VWEALCQFPYFLGETRHGKFTEMERKIGGGKKKTIGWGGVSNKVTNKGEWGKSKEEARVDLFINELWRDIPTGTTKGKKSGENPQKGAA